MPRIHVVANQKGGVGKTTLAVNLAAVTADVLGGDPEASPVLVCSTDPQASSVWWADRVGDELPFDFVQADDGEPAQLAQLRRLSQYQHIFVDTPGSLENTHILARVLDVADDVVVPLETEGLAFDPTTRTVEKVIKPRGLPYKVVITKWDPRDGRSDLDGTIEYVDAKGWPRCNVVVRRYKVHARAGLEGRVVTQYARNRVAMEAREDFFRLALELGYGAPAASTPATAATGG